MYSTSLACVKWESSQNLSILNNYEVKKGMESVVCYEHVSGYLD